MADDYAGFGEYQPPQSPSGASPAAPRGYEDFGRYRAPAPKAYPRNIGRGEAVGRGFKEGASFGFDPAMQGVVAAGQQGSGIAGRESDEYPLSGGFDVLRGAGRLIKENVIDPLRGVNPVGIAGLVTGDRVGPATKAYRTVRDREHQANEEAFEQHPGYYTGGQVGGALVTPMGQVRGGTLLERVWSAAKIGAKAGAVQGAGEAVSSGGGPYEAAIGAAKGAPLGAVLGAGGSAILEGAGRAYTRAGDIYRGAMRTQDQAARGVRGAMEADRVPMRDPGDFSHLSGAARTSSEAAYARDYPNGQDPYFAGLDRETEAAAARAGLPILNIDRGGQTTRDLGRTAGNVSPEAWGRLEQATTERAEARPQRISDMINRLFSSGRARNPRNRLDAGADIERLQAESRRANAPAYRAAYDAGDRPIWSPELERLVGASPSIRAAMASAIKSGQDRAAEQGFGAFNPGVQVTPDGRIVFPQRAGGRAESAAEAVERRLREAGGLSYNSAAKGLGLPSQAAAPTPAGTNVYPNMQYWDYVQRDLADMVQRVQGREPDKARYLNSLHQQLNSELDRLVPEFQQARVGAWRFFQAQDAVEAGRRFVKMNADSRQAARQIEAMSAPDRELFARGFADELSQSVLRLPNSVGTLRSIFTSPAAAEKIRVALGNTRAREVEALMRAEAIAQRSRDALGNSTTARQQEMLRAFRATGAAHGIAGAGAVGAFEFLNDQDFDPRAILSTALIIGAVRGGAHRVDTRVMRRIGEMLASEDPITRQRGVQAVARSPTLFDALRRGTTAGTRITARDIGPDRALAGSAAILADIISHEEEHHHATHPDNQQTAPLQ